MADDFLNKLLNSDLVPIALVLIVAFIVNFLIRKFLKGSFNNRLIHVGFEPSHYSFIKNVSSFVIFAIAFAYILHSIPAFSSIGKTLFAGAGIAAAAVAFASQEAMSNVINGLFLVLHKPFRVGDIIKVGDSEYGEVEDVTLRHTIIKSFENRRIIIPNSVLAAQTITNSSIRDEKMCLFIEFGISYDSSVDLAKKIIREEATKHPDFIDNRTKKERKDNEEPLIIRMIEHGDFAIKLRANFWAKDPFLARVAKYDLLESIKKRFDAEGIEIPFPYRTLVFKNETDKNKLMNK